MRAEIEDAERSVGLHDLKLFGIFVQEVAVGKEDIGHQACPPALLSCRRGMKSVERADGSGDAIANSVAPELRAAGSRSRSRSQVVFTPAAVAVLPGFQD